MSEDALRRRRRRLTTPCKVYTHKWAFSKTEPKRIELLHTRHLEEAARELAARYERVFVRNKNILWNPIRLRRSQLQDLKPFIVLNPPAFDAELAAWNERGGMVIYDRSYRMTENVAAHQAQLLSECPLSLADLDNYVDGARDVAVVYWPPRWDEHRRCVGLLWPSAELCKRFYELVTAAATNEELRRVLDLPAGSTVAGDAELCAALELTPAQLWRVRNATFRMRDYKIVTPVILRVPPEDATLAQVYRYIEREYPDVGGMRLIVGSSLAKAAKHWKVALKALARCGAIERKETLFCHLPDVMPPHWFKIQAEHERAGERLAEIIARVEASPELSLPLASVSPRARAPRARSRSKSAA